MSQSICSSRSLIDPKFAHSPYLSKPIGRCSKERRRRSGDSAKATPNLNPVKDNKKVAARGDASVGSYQSVRSVRTTKAHQPYQQAFGLNNSARQKLLLPRETEKLLRSFRQKVQSNGDQQHASDDGDNSTICTDDCLSLDDRAVYVSINSCEKARESVFSGPVFAELSLREKKPGPNALPPLAVNSEPDDVSDLESLASKQHETRRERRKSRRKPR